MSIAVSVIAGPSRIHRVLLAAWGLAQAAAALAIGLGMPARFPFASWTALLLAASAALLVRAAARPPKTHRIDISGIGEFRVTVQQNRAPGSRPEAPAPSVAAACVLLPGSTVWPVLAMLRYGVQNPPDEAAAAVWVLPVWRDSMAPAAWRALVVALAVIGRRDGEKRFDNIR